MAFPNFENKTTLKSITNPDEFLEYAKNNNRYPSIKIPQGIIFCYQTKLLNHVVNTGIQFFYLVFGRY